MVSRLRYLALILALADLLLVSSLVHAVVLAKENIPTGTAGPMSNSDTIGRDHTVSDISFSEVAFQIIH